MRIRHAKYGKSRRQTMLMQQILGEGRPRPSCGTGVAPGADPDSIPTAPRASPARILCIDDDPEISRIIQLRLKDYGLEVSPAFHGMHGYWLAIKERPDLIITDLAMPQGQGDYVLECLKRNTKVCHIPVIVLTGKRAQGLKARMEQLGAAACLSKPIQIAALMRTVMSHLPKCPGIAPERHADD